MDEIILSIDTFANIYAELPSTTCGRSLEGVKIKTSFREVFIGIDNERSCCESFGSIIFQESFSDFIGAKLVKLTTVDSDYNVSDNLLPFFLTKRDVTGKTTEYDSEAIFINIETTNGLLQAAVYNFHNGYYGHDVRIWQVMNDSEPETILQTYI